MQKDATKKIKWALSLLVILIVIVAGFISVTRKKDTGDPTLTVNNHRISIEIAKTPEEKTKGLCCRDSLGENAGMLFVYERPGNYRYWMKDTRIPLDMYWINSERKIVHIEHSVKPESYPKTYGSPEPAQYILETNAGFAKRNNITAGDTVRF